MRLHILCDFFSLFFFALQYKSERSSLGSPQDWKEKPEAPAANREEGALNSKNGNGFGVRSLEQHVAALNLLESK